MTITGPRRIAHHNTNITLLHNHYHAIGNGPSPSDTDGQLLLHRSTIIDSIVSSNCVGGLGHTSGRHARAKHLGWIPFATHPPCQNCNAGDLQTQVIGLSVKNEHELARCAGDQWTQALGPLVKNEHELAQHSGGSPSTGTCPSGYIPGDTSTGSVSMRETTLTPTDAVRGDKTSVVITRRSRPPVVGREETSSRAICAGSIPAEAPPQRQRSGERGHCANLSSSGVAAISADRPPITVPSSLVRDSSLAGGPAGAKKVRVDRQEEPREPSSALCGFRRIRGAGCLQHTRPHRPGGLQVGGGQPKRFPVHWSIPVPVCRVAAPVWLQVASFIIYVFFILFHNPSPQQVTQPTCQFQRTTRSTSRR